MTEKPTPEDALEQAIGAFQEMPVPDKPPDGDVLARLAGAPAVPSPRPPKRRFYMRRTFWYAAAAAVLFALFGWGLLSQRGSLAMADVVEAAEKHQLVRFKLKQLTKDYKAPDRTVLADLKAFRNRSESREIDGTTESVNVVIQDGQKNRALTLSTDTDVRTGTAVTKVAILYKMRDDLKPLGDIKPYQPLLNFLRELRNHKKTTSAQDTLDGRKTVKYRLEDDEEAITAWVDPETKLPVRMECEMRAPDGRRYKCAFTDFEWDPDVKDVEQLFSTEPPEGYTFRDATGDNP